MNQLRRGVHRTILVFDVEGFGNSRRAIPDQLAVREGVYGALQETFSGFDVSWKACDKEDRGDGLFILVPDTEKSIFAESFPLRLARAIRAHNESHAPEARFRLRMSLHAGEIHSDDHGKAGTALNEAFRLVDAAPVKSALKGSSGVLAVIASSWFYREVIRNSEECHSDAYRPVLVREKETSTTGWVALPDQPGPDSSEGPGHWRIRILDPAGNVHGAGVLLHGRYVITTATAVAQALGVASAAHRPPGRVPFDLPGQPRSSRRHAEIVCWQSATAADGSGLAGLSIVGPAIRGVGCPPFQRAGLSARAATTWCCPNNPVAACGMSNGC